MKRILHLLTVLLMLSPCLRGDSAEEAWQRFEDDSRDLATLAEVLPQMTNPERKSEIRSLLLEEPPRAELVQLLNHPMLAVRLGALEILEELAGGDLAYNPWAPADSPENATSIVRWTSWAREPTDPDADAELFSEEQKFGYLRDILGENRDKAARARHMLEAEGFAAVGFLETYLQETPTLPPGHRARVREAQYQIVLARQLGDQAANVAHQLAFGSRDQVLSALGNSKNIGLLAMPILRDFIDHADPLVRETAVDSLLAVGGGQAVEIVAPLLQQEPDVNVIHGAMRRLKDIPGAKTQELVASFLNSPDEDLLISAIRTSLSLSNGNHSSVFGNEKSSTSPTDQSILKSLKDDRWRVRAASLEYVTKKRFSAAKDICIELLDDPDEFVRFAAIQAIAGLGAKDALPKLRAMFYNDESMAGPVVAGFDALETPLDEEFFARLDAASPEAKLAAIGAVETSKSHIPLLMRYVDDANLDVACAALRSLVADSDLVQVTRVKNAILTALRSGSPEKIDAILGRIELPKSGIKDPRIFQPLESALNTAAAAETSTNLDPLYDAFMAPQLSSDEVEVIPNAEEKIAQEIKKYAAEAKAADDPFRAALILAKASYPAGFIKLQELLPSLSTAQKTTIGGEIYEPSVQEAAPVLAALMQDPTSEVRSEAASAALSNTDSKMFADLVFQELGRPNSLLTPQEVFSYRFNSVAKSASLRTTIQAWAAATLESEDRPSSHKVLAAIALQESAAPAAVEALKSQTSAADPLVRRAVWHSLLNIRPQLAQTEAAEILADPEAFVREALPQGINSEPYGWQHHFSDLDFVEDTRWSSNERSLPLTSELRDLLNRQRLEDPSPGNRFEAAFVLLLAGENLDLAEFAELMQEAPKEHLAARRLGAWMEKNLKRATPALAPLFAVIDRSGISSSDLEELEAKILPDQPEGFSTFASLANLQAIPPPETGSLLADETESEPVERRSLPVLFFYKPGCPECQQARRLLDSLQKDFPLIELHEHNILAAEGTLLNQALCQQFEVPSAKHTVSPAIFTQSGFLIRDDISAANLGGLLATTMDTSQDDSWFQVESAGQKAAKQAIDRRYASYTLPLVLGAGLLDGVNPCAFATIIFLLSYLQIARRTPREMLMVGAAFISAVFLAYLLAGLVLYQFLAILNDQFAGIQTGMNLIFGLLALLAAYLSFRDAWVSRSGRMDEMTLQLPGFLKNRIRSVIRTSARARNFVIAAFVCGIVVSLLELACTGQVYAPIIYQIQLGRLDAVGWLVLYNLAFITPLVVVFLLAYGGMRSETLIALQKKHTVWVKLGLGFLFVLLAVFILFGQKLLHFQ